MLRDVRLQSDSLFGSFDPRLCSGPAAVLIFQFRRNFGKHRVASANMYCACASLACFPAASVKRGHNSLQRRTILPVAGLFQFAGQGFEAGRYG